MSIAAFTPFWEIKRKPEDFKVNEIPIAAFNIQQEDSYTCIKVEKIGLTTIDAASLISKYTDVQLMDVRWSGLKDEDGETTQIFSVKGRFGPEDVRNISALISSDNSVKQTIIRVAHIGYASQPLKSGQLLGNTFHINIRGVTKKQLEIIKRIKSEPFVFINYYDSQRFGRPSEPKINHLLGDALIKGDDVLFNELYNKKTKKNISMDRFDNISPATLDELILYKNANESRKWNDSLVNQLAHIDDAGLGEVIIEGHRYIYCDQFKMAQQFGISSTKEIVRHTATSDINMTTTSRRAVLIQVSLSWGREIIDPIHNLYCVPISFFLPSGCYGTNAIRQLEFQVSSQINEQLQG